MSRLTALQRNSAPVLQFPASGHNAKCDDTGRGDELGERQATTRLMGWGRVGVAAIGLGWIFIALRMLVIGIKQPRTSKYVDSLGHWSNPGLTAPRTPRGLIAVGVVGVPIGLDLVIFAVLLA